MKKKTKFVVEPFDDIRIIGINTGMQDYQLAWNINKFLKLNLVRYKDVISEDGDFFSFYLYVSFQSFGENLIGVSVLRSLNCYPEWK